MPEQATIAAAGRSFQLRAHPDADIDLQSKGRREVTKPGGRRLPDADAPSGEAWADLLGEIYAEALAGPSLGADAVDIVRRLRDGDLI
jgi:hypothetical protein